MTASAAAERRKVLRRRLRPHRQKPYGCAVLRPPVRRQGAVRMEELRSSDMVRVIVEGKVFAVEHRELKKRGAWVVSFDMTDYTGSVRVKQFLGGRTGQADHRQRCRPGDVAARTGQDRVLTGYDNEMVLQAECCHGTDARPPKRARYIAPRKRVELHLHTHYVHHGRADRYRQPPSSSAASLGPPRHRHHRPRRAPSRSRTR